MHIMRSKSGDAVGVEIGTVSFRSLIRVLGRLPDAKIREAKQNSMNDEAFAAFDYRGQRFEVHTPLSDYWIDRPDGCPTAIFEEVVQHLERFPIRWWHRVF